jgi:hypothetical protein
VLDGGRVVHVVRPWGGRHSVALGVNCPVLGMVFIVFGIAAVARLGDCKEVGRRRPCRYGGRAGGTFKGRVNGEGGVPSSWSKTSAVEIEDHTDLHQQLRDRPPPVGRTMLACGFHVVVAQFGKGSATDDRVRLQGHAGPGWGHSVPDGHLEVAPGLGWVGEGAGGPGGDPPRRSGDIRGVQYVVGRDRARLA